MTYPAASEWSNRIRYALHTQIVSGLFVSFSGLEKRC